MRASTCKGCGAAIVWIRTPGGKSMPCDATPRYYIGYPGFVINALFAFAALPYIGRPSTPTSNTLFLLNEMLKLLDHANSPVKFLVFNVNSIPRF